MITSAGRGEILLTFNSNTREQNFDHADSVVIGLVNNMPDAALRATERQFCELLSLAARDRTVSLRLFSLPGVHRESETQSYLRRRYTDISELWGSHLDGLIVTGAEPRSAALVDEPYWPVLAKLVDWTDDHTISSIWSCLAAQAAVFRLDDIRRRRFGKKLFGVFDCVKATEHPLLAEMPPQWWIPHSRCHDLAEQTLADRGYRILSRSDAVGADMFVKRKNSLFVFLQGHPEYDGAALLHEYRRDIRQFLAGQRDDYPEMPCGYFDGNTTAVLAALKERALRNQTTDLLHDFPIGCVEEESVSAWHQLAIQLYANWLSYLVEQKHLGRRLRASNGFASPT